MLVNPLRRLTCYCYFVLLHQSSLLVIELSLVVEALRVENDLRRGEVGVEGDASAVHLSYQTSRVYLFAREVLLTEHLSESKELADPSLLVATGSI